MKLCYWILGVILTLTLGFEVQAGNPVYSITYQNETEVPIELKFTKENCGVMKGGWSVNVPAHGTAHRMIYKNNSHGCNGNFNTYVHQQVYAQGKNIGTLQTTAWYGNHFQLVDEVSYQRPPFVQSQVQNSSGSLKITFSHNYEYARDYDRRH